MSDDPRVLADRLDALSDAWAAYSDPRGYESGHTFPSVASILRAFAELPTSTQALAHAAATVRARLGEGWEIGWHDHVVEARKRDHNFHYFSLLLGVDGGWLWSTNGSSAPGWLDSLDDAITAALAVLGETE